MSDHLTIILTLTGCLVIYVTIKGYRKIIFWIADVSGISDQIRNRTIKDIGSRIYHDHFWFNGGVPGAWMVCNTLKKYGDALRNLQMPNVSEIRSDIYKCGDKHEDGA
jgi:hypothetical protein